MRGFIIFTIYIIKMPNDKPGYKMLQNRFTLMLRILLFKGVTKRPSVNENPKPLMRTRFFSNHWCCAISKFVISYQLTDQLG